MPSHISLTERGAKGDPPWTFWPWLQRPDAVKAPGSAGEISSLCGLQVQPEAAKITWITHFRQRFSSKWIMFPFICLIFIGTIFTLWSVIPTCLCLLYIWRLKACVHYHRPDLANLFIPQPSLLFHNLHPHHLLNNLSCNQMIFHTFMSFPKENTSHFRGCLSTVCRIKSFESIL